MIKITKQLDRPDGGVVPPNSIVSYNPTQKPASLVVLFRLKLHFDQAALDAGKPGVPAVNDFSYKQSKVCTQAEWDALKDDAGAAALLAGWLKDILDDGANLGAGNTELIP